MSLSDLERAWTGIGYRHLPAASTKSVLDDEYLGLAATNRWNRQGTRAYYFSSGIGVITAEFGRHIAEELPDGVAERQERQVWRVPISLERTLDLRDPNTVKAMGARSIKDWILDAEATWAAVAYQLAQTTIEGLIVPSVAFLDDLDRCNFVIYRDRIDRRKSFGTPEHVQDLVLTGVGGRQQV